MPNTTLVFLDQNHWIYLAKSYWGAPLHPSHNGVAADLYEYILREDVRLPLNVIHLIEYYRNDSAERRARLAEVYDQFSRNWFFTAWDDLIIREIEHAVFNKFAPQLVLNPLEVIGRGFFFGFGSKLQEKWKDQGPKSEIDFLKQILAQSGQLYNLLTFPNEVGRSQQKTYIKNINNRQKKAAEDLRAIRGPHPKKTHRLAEYAGYTRDQQKSISIALAKVGKEFDDFIALGVDDLTKFWQSVPSLDVNCELTVYRDRQLSRRIDCNDVADIGYLSTAIPYCNAIVVERFWAHAIKQTGLADKYGVIVLTDIRELTEWLSTRGKE